MNIEIAKGMNKYLLSIIVILTFFSINSTGSEYLFEPTNEDIEALKNVYRETGVPLAIPFVYEYRSESLNIYTAIPISNRMRGGVHARIMVHYGIINDLQESKEVDHGMRGGTLFVDSDKNGNVYLATHSRNSTHSTIHYRQANLDRKKPVPPKILQKISNSLQIPIRVARKDLRDTIDRINVERKGSIIFKYPKLLLRYLNLKQVSPQKVGIDELNPYPPSPEEVERIIENRKLKPSKSEKREGKPPESCWKILRYS